MKKKNASILYFATIFILITFNSLIKPSKAFIPKVHEPNLNELKIKGKAYGKTAAQLLYFGQIKKAKQFANLAVRLSPYNDQLWSILAETQIRNKELYQAKKSLNKV